MANRESGDYRRDRNRDEEFRGGAEERGRSPQGSGSYGRDYEEGRRGQEFSGRELGREHETGGRGQGWQSGSPGYGSQGYGGQSQQSSQGGRGFDRETGAWSGAPGYESQGYGSQGSQGYGSQSGSRYEQGRSVGFDRGFEGENRESGSTYGGYGRSQGFSGASQGQSYSRRGYGEGFGGATSPSGYGRGMQGFGETSGYSEGQFGTPSRTRGRYTGRGPKGYTRSDDRIREDVSDRLEQHGDIDASEIVVMVEAAEVTLEGTVPDRRTKRMAEDLAEDSPGVKQVHNRLRIQGNGGEGEGNRSSQSASGSQSTSGQRGQSGQSSGQSGTKSTTRS